MDEESKHRMRWTNRGADNRSPNRSGDFSHKRVRYEDDGSPQQHRGGYRGFSGHRRPQIPTKGSHDGETNFPNGLRSNRAASQSSRYHRRYE